jgi:hypothetical protein
MNANSRWEFCLGTAIKSVTGVTNGLGAIFYDSHHETLFSGAFQQQLAGS